MSTQDIRDEIVVQLAEQDDKGNTKVKIWRLRISLSQQIEIAPSELASHLTAMLGEKLIQVGYQDGRPDSVGLTISGKARAAALRGQVPV